MAGSRRTWQFCSVLAVLLLGSATAAFPADVYVHDIEASQIFAFTDTVPTLLNPTIPLQANGMAFDEHRNLVLATAMPGSCIVRLDPDSEDLIVVADTLGPGEIAIDVYEDATSDLYVLAHVPGAPDSVHPRLELLPDGLPPAVPVWEFTESQHVDDIMVYPAGVRGGNVLVLTQDPGYLIELERTGPTTFAEDRALPLTGEPAGFSITPTGQVIVLDALTGLYIVGQPDTLIPFGSATGPGLSDISVGADGTIYVTNDTLAVVHRFDSDGIPILPDLDGTTIGVGPITAPCFAPTPAGTDVIVEPLEGIVVLFEDVARAGYTTATAVASSLRISPNGNYLPDYALLPASPRGSEQRISEFTYVSIATTARNKSLIQVDMYQDGERLYFANGVCDTFRDFTITGSLDDARGTIPRFSELTGDSDESERPEDPSPNQIELVLVDDSRPVSQVVAHKIERTDVAMSVPPRPKLETALPYPGGGPDGGRDNLEQCPWGQVRRLREYLSRAEDEYASGNPVEASFHLEQLNAELRYVAGWCVPDSTDARLGNLVGEMLSNSKTLQFSLSEVKTSADTTAVQSGQPTLALSIPSSPIEGTCQFHISGPEGFRAKLQVFSASGRLVADVYDGVLPSEPVVAEWDCRDRTGARAAAGVYFARVESAGRVATSKLVLIR